MDKKKLLKKNSTNNWVDPLYLEDLLTEEEQSIRKTTKDYCKNKLLPNVIEHNKKCYFDKKIYKEFGSLGFLGLSIKGYGAANASNVAYGLVTKEFESIDSSYRSAISVQSSLVINPIFYFGSEEQKEKYLPELIKGNLHLLRIIAGHHNGHLMATFLFYLQEKHIINQHKSISFQLMEVKQFP